MTSKLHFLLFLSFAMLRSIGVEFLSVQFMSTKLINVASFLFACKSINFIVIYVNVRLISFLRE